MTDLRVGTYNVANFTDHSGWDTRKLRIADHIRKANCDIVGLQALRFDFNQSSYFRRLTASFGYKRPSSSLEPPHQLLDLMSLLPEFPYFVWEPAMQYNEWLIEGLAVISKHHFLDCTTFKLGNCEGDRNRRVVVVARVQVPQGVVDFIVTHWTNSVKGQLSQAYRTLKHVRDIAQKSIPQILVGDFNIKNAFELPMLMLEGSYDGYKTKGDFTDVWKMLKPHKLGKTYPVWRPKQRYDRILVRGGIRATRVEVAGVLKQERPAVLHASDHCFVYADLALLRR
jgi:endonuclease/exonuclease/phosphatase family metal-dependent hydrolase